jgi:hypothetical protein
VALVPNRWAGVDLQVVCCFLYMVANQGQVWGCPHVTKVAWDEADLALCV